MLNIHFVLYGNKELMVSKRDLNVENKLYHSQQNYYHYIRGQIDLPDCCFCSISIRVILPWSATAAIIWSITNFSHGQLSSSNLPPSCSHANCQQNVGSVKSNPMNYIVFHHNQGFLRTIEMPKRKLFYTCWITSCIYLVVVSI